jgi:uncharacterized protein
VASWHRKVQGASFCAPVSASVHRMIIGVISDTHGLLRPEALIALRGSEHIIHAGDIGSQGILDELSKLAPVTAIRGNIDTAPWSQHLPTTNLFEKDSVSVYVLHDLKALDLNPKAAGFSAVISGHSHSPKTEWKNGVLYFNPGSAGPRRFRLPISVGRIHVADGQLTPEFIKLA